MDTDMCCLCKHTLVSPEEPSLCGAGPSPVLTPAVSWGQTWRQSPAPGKASEDALDTPAGSSQPPSLPLLPASCRLCAPAQGSWVKSEGLGGGRGGPEPAGGVPVGGGGTLEPLSLCGPGPPSPAPSHHLKPQSRAEFGASDPQTHSGIPKLSPYAPAFMAGPWHSPTLGG